MVQFVPTTRYKYLHTQLRKVISTWTYRPHNPPMMLLHVAPCVCLISDLGIWALNIEVFCSNYWLILQHGYRLPEEEVLSYCAVQFWRGEPLTYPKLCVLRHFPIITPIPKPAEVSYLPSTAMETCLIHDYHKIILIIYLSENCANQVLEWLKEQNV